MNDEILSLRTPKRRIETKSGANFYNDFSNALHVDCGELQTSIALNLGSSNWTASDIGELAFLGYPESGSELTIINAKKQLMIHQKLSEHPVVNLIFTESNFYAEMLGILISGNRTADGGLAWKGSRGIDRGVDFIFSLNDGVIKYTKRASCRNYFYNTETGKKDSIFSPELLWNIAFNGAFVPEYYPPYNKENELSLTAIMEEFISSARTRKPSEAGVRLFSLINFILINNGNISDLERAIAFDWKIQCENLLDEAFPCSDFITYMFKKGIPETEKECSIDQRKIMRWVNNKRKISSIAKNSKPVRFLRFSEITIPDEC